MIEDQLGHRTIREFRDQPVSEEVVELLGKVAMRTASSRGLQHAGIIRVRDMHKRQELARIGKQEYVARAPEYFLFIVDAHRSAGILQECGGDPQAACRADVFVEGFTDACLMAQNVVNAAEELGLGTNYLGNVQNDPLAVVRLLGMPKLTFPVVGLTFGYPAQDPQCKPRMDASLRMMVDEYRQPQSWVAALADYDERMRTYYDLRDSGSPSDPFTQQVVHRIASPLQANRTIAAAISQGFDLAG
ncbi:nitroreductase family protein [Trueperella sp. LYQ141]|uniref:nitroreductase family protein n=1 Tax=Trueperella sp. LYQ141 TaxID=3391058 RepID=UPI00398302E4